jgi:hypothetical protein
MISHVLQHLLQDFQDIFLVIHDEKKFSLAPDDARFFRALSCTGVPLEK